VEWTTESEGLAPPLPSHPLPEEGHFREESLRPPVTNAPPPVPTHAVPEPATVTQAPAGYEQCPSCGAFVAVDQRYCLECGHRRGEPRLPFMDAVVFMDAMNRPPETETASKKKAKRGVSPNAALIAGIGTLLLALGIGVLIGRSGDHGATTSNQAPIVIKGGGAGAEEAATASSAGAGGGSVGAAGGSVKGKSKKQVVKQKTKEAESGAGANEVLHTNPDVKMAPPTVKIGGKCEKDAAGCNEEGEFDGSFFGE
jgi:hypothetical protein